MKQSKLEEEIEEKKTQLLELDRARQLNAKLQQVVNDHHQENSMQADFGPIYNVLNVFNDPHELARFFQEKENLTVRTLEVRYHDVGKQVKNGSWCPKGGYTLRPLATEQITVVYTKKKSTKVVKVWLQVVTVVFWAKPIPWEKSLEKEIYETFQKTAVPHRRRIQRKNTGQNSSCTKEELAVMMLGCYNGGCGLCHRYFSPTSNGYNLDRNIEKMAEPRSNLERQLREKLEICAEKTHNLGKSIYLLKITPLDSPCLRLS